MNGLDVLPFLLRRAKNFEAHDGTLPRDVSTRQYEKVLPEMAATVVVSAQQYQPGRRSKA